MSSNPQHYITSHWERKLVPCKETQVSLGFSISQGGFWIPVFVSKIGLWIPIVSWIPDSLSCIPDSKNPGFPIP